MTAHARLSLTLGALVVACAPAGPSIADIEADVAAITAVRQQEVAAVTSGTADVSYMADDAVVMPPNEPAARGKAAIEAWFTAFMTAMSATVEYSNTNITVSGDWAVETYAATFTVTPRAGGAPMTETLKGVHVYRRSADGAWKMVYDVWNSDTPMPGM